MHLSISRKGDRSQAAQFRFSNGSELHKSRKNDFDALFYITADI